MQDTTVASTNEIQSVKFKLQSYFPPTTLLHWHIVSSPLSCLSTDVGPQNKTIKTLFCLLDKKEKSVQKERQRQVAFVGHLLYHSDFGSKACPLQLMGLNHCIGQRFIPT